MNKAMLPIHREMEANITRSVGLPREIDVVTRKATTTDMATPGARSPPLSATTNARRAMNSGEEHSGIDLQHPNVSPTMPPTQSQNHLSESLTLTTKL